MLNSTAAENRFAVVILAAGKGTRLKSRHPKVLHKIAGRTLLEHVIAATSHLVPARDTFVVIGHEAERVRAAVESTGVNFVEQPQQRGTGDAMKCAQPALRGYEHAIVLMGDAPLIRPETLQRLREFHLQQQADITILTAEPEDPTGYGRIVRKMVGGRPSASVAAIVEQKMLSAAQMSLREINSGIYGFRLSTLFQHIGRLTDQNAAGEFYLTDMAAIVGEAGGNVVALPAATATEVLGINSRMELAQLDAAARARICAALMNSGVTIYRPETTVIDADVTVGTDTIIEPFVQLVRGSRIGADCHIQSYCVISNSQVADGVAIRPGCVITDSVVGAAATLGPYSHLRPGSEIGEGAHVGNFVETKKVRLGAGAKANHLTYLGDAEIGARVNVGAGTITCNYDGVHKHETVIEEGAFIGSDSTLVAPVRIGAGAYIGAASCITENVPPDALAVGRGRQITKPGWAAARRAQRNKSG
ncbi:MAG: bifunctional UDP-N-acetylglucosamine diphosphorylase/glucosamine-1-phosphate N-acetyltransferase GlmU [Acidobacteria bacterium]|nr:bifunctional UDP-N-acetylglucosamine diphosphorylase/glucosamine-1-phosphate N-acetyltransferase GlmU [Acidobacteriota bacterium]